MIEQPLFYLVYIMKKEKNYNHLFLDIERIYLELIFFYSTMQKNLTDRMINI
jgi:hypothetical protein